MKSFAMPKGDDVMKRAVALALTLVLLLTTFAGCIKKTDGSPEPEDTSEYEALYAPVLKKYKQAFDEGWSREKFAENHLAPGLANLEKTAEPSFAFVDLDGDKTPELFIGRADEPATAYDMYSIKDDTISQLTDAAQDTTLTLTDDCRMIETDDSYAHLEVTVIYEVKDGEVTMVEALIHDPDMMIDGMHPFFRATAPLPADEKEIYGELVEVISEEDYSRAATQYKKAETQMKTFEELDEATLEDSSKEIVPMETDVSPVPYEMRKETFDHKSNSGILVYSNTIEYPYFLGTTPGEIAANEVIRKSIEKCKYMEQSEVEDALIRVEDMAKNNESFLPLYYDYQYELNYNDHGYLSIFERFVDWAGGVHPYAFYESYTWDVLTGEEKTYDFFFRCSVEERESIIWQQTKEVLEGTPYYNGGERPGENWMEDIPFTLTEDGLNFHRYETFYLQGDILVPYTPGEEPFIYSDGSTASTEQEMSDTPQDVSYEEIYAPVLQQYKQDVDENRYGWCSYAYHDIDEDGVPELLIESGQSMADNHVSFYTCQNNEAVYLGESSAGSFDDDDHAVVLCYAHTGIGYYQYISIENGALHLSDQIFFEYDQDWNASVDNPAVGEPIDFVQMENE